MEVDELVADKKEILDASHPWGVLRSSSQRMKNLANVLRSSSQRISAIKNKLFQSNRISALKKKLLPLSRF